MSKVTARIERDVIVATGKDARSFLHSQLSNDIASLAAGAATHAFALEPTGKITALFRVHCVADDHFVLDVDAGCGEVALQRLNKFKIRVQCNFVLTTQTIIALRGLDEAETVRALAEPSAIRAWRVGDGAVDMFDSAANTPTVPADSQSAYHAARVRCGWPIFNVDISSASLPAETGLVDVAVSFTKGCYPGQELVERMDSRGSTAPLCLMRLPALAPGGERAVTGEPYRTTAGELGQCTSVAGEFALVLVRRAHLGDAQALLHP